MRVFLEHYEQVLSLVDAADLTGIGHRLPYVWQHRAGRTGKWFRMALARAEHAGVQRVRATGVRRAVEKSDVMLLAILRARDPWFMPAPRPVVQKVLPPPPAPNVSISSTSIQFGTFTDAEMREMDRLLEKAGVPRHMLQPPPIDIDQPPPDEGGQS